MWRGYSDADSEISEDWESGSEEGDKVSQNAKDWLKPTTKSLHRLQEVKPSVYNIGLCDVNQIKSTRSKVRDTASETEVKPGDGRGETVPNGLLQKNRTAWGSSNSLAELTKTVQARRRPESAKLTTAQRPPSGKRARPLSAQPRHLTSQTSEKSTGMAILGSKYDPTSAQHPQRENSREVQHGWLPKNNHRPRSAVCRSKPSTTLLNSGKHSKSRADNHAHPDVKSDIITEASVEFLHNSPSLPKMEKIHFSLPSMSEDAGDEDMRIATERLLTMAMDRHTCNRDTYNFDEGDNKLGADTSANTKPEGAFENSKADTGLSSSNGEFREKLSFRPPEGQDLTVGENGSHNHSGCDDNGNNNSEEDVTSLAELLKQFASEHCGSVGEWNGVGSGNPDEKLRIKISVLDSIGRTVDSKTECSKTESMELQKSKHCDTNNSNFLPEHKYAPLATVYYQDDLDFAVSKTLNSSQDVETMMSNMVDLENRGVFSNADNSKLSYREIDRSRISQSRHRDLPRYGNDQPKEETVGSHANQSKNSLCAEGKTSNGSQSNQGTDLLGNSSGDKNYREMGRGKHNVKYQQVSHPEKGKPDHSEINSEQIEIVGIRTGSLTPNIDSHCQKADQRPVSRCIHSGGNSLLRRPRTKSAPVNKPLRRRFSLSSDAPEPRLTMPSVVTPESDDDANVSANTDTCSVPADTTLKKEDKFHEIDAALDVSTDIAVSLQDRVPNVYGQDQSILQDGTCTAEVHVRCAPEANDVIKTPEVPKSEEKLPIPLQKGHSEHTWGNSLNKPDLKIIKKRVSASVSMNKGHYLAFSRNFSHKQYKSTPSCTERVLPGYNIVTKKPEQQELETEELLECRRLQDKLSENGVCVQLHTLKRALLPPDGSTCYYECSVPNELPKCNTEGLLSHPKIWLRDEYRQLMVAKKALARANEQMRRQREQENKTDQKLKKTKPVKKSKKAGRQIKRSKSVT